MDYDLITINIDNATSGKVFLIADSSVTYQVSVVHSHLGQEIDSSEPLNAPEEPNLKRFHPRSDAYLTMLASEALLRRDWDLPEEDEAWKDL